MRPRGNLCPESFYADRMDASQGPSETTVLCDACMAHLTQLLSDWHAFMDVLEPLLGDETRVRGHLLSVIDQVDACRAGRHAGG